MSLTHEPAGSKILEKNKIYILGRAKLLCSICHEIPCISKGQLLTGIFALNKFGVHSKYFRNVGSSENLVCRVTMEGSFWQKEGLLQQTMTLLQETKDPFLPNLLNMRCNKICIMKQPS